MKFDRKFKPELCASQDLTRESLAHVELDTESKVMVATNGGCMVVIPVTLDSNDKSGPIHTDALTVARKAAKKLKQTDAEINANGVLNIPAAGIDMQRPSERGFVQWEQAVPKDRKVTVAFNAKMLKDIADAIGSPDGVVYLSIGEELDPIVVWNGLGNGFGNGEADVQNSDRDPFGILMPCRFSLRRR